MKRALLVVIIFLTSTFYGESSASAAVADCVTLGAPNVASTSTSISVQVSITTNCSSNQLGSNGGSPRYSILDENTNTSSCSGPETLSSGRTYSIRCTINISLSSGSTRFGATSSVLQIYFGRDGSVRQVPFNHLAIAGKSTCEQAPIPPILKITYPDANSGPKFEVITNMRDSRQNLATNIYWAYRLFNSTTNIWEPWRQVLRVQTDENGFANFFYQSELNSQFSKIGFQVYGFNQCGRSDVVYENSQQDGVPLEGKKDPVLSINLDGITLNKTYNKEVLFTVEGGLRLNMMSLTPSICLLNNETLIPITIGNCLLEVSVKGFLNFSDIDKRQVMLKVLKMEQSFNEATLISRFWGESLSALLKSEQNLSLNVVSANSSVCVLDKEFIRTIIPGICSILVSNNGNETFQPFSKTVTFSVLKKNQIIIFPKISAGTVLNKSKYIIKVKSTSGLPVYSKNQTGAICEFKNNILQVNKSGVCKFELNQPGNDKYNPAPKIAIKMTVTSN